MLAAIVLAMASLSFNEVRAATVTVNVGANGSLMFSPSSVKIKVGDTVQWVWKSGGHSVVSGMPGAPTGQFSSGILNSGATFSRTFSSAGKVNYYCGPHGGCCQMIGTVEVETETPTPTPTPTPSPSATAAPTPAPTPLVPNVAEGLLRIEVKAIVSGLTATVDLVAPNDGSGRLLVIGQTGIVTLKVSHRAF